jgi:hypothetical protein
MKMTAFWDVATYSWAETDMYQTCFLPPSSSKCLTKMSRKHISISIKHFITEGSHLQNPETSK